MHKNLLLISGALIMGFNTGIAWAKTEVVRVSTQFIEPCSTIEYQNGMHRQYYDDGRTYIEVNCVDGIKDGLLSKYYPTGSLWREENYIRGKLEGKLKEFYKNENLKYEETYEDGQLEGTQYAYFPKGELLSEKNYKNGKIDGLDNTYDIQGNLLDSKMVTVSEFIDEEGMPTKVVIKGKSVKKGRPVSRINQANQIYQPLIKENMD